MWADKTKAYRYLFCYSIQSLTKMGIKAVYAPYRLSDTYYTNAMDLLYETHCLVPMKEAMVSSARFPVLTAPGLIWQDTLNTKTKGWGWK